jgi:hypothetical protein
MSFLNLALSGQMRSLIAFAIYQYRRAHLNGVSKQWHLDTCEEIASRGLHIQCGLARKLVCPGRRLSKAARTPCRQLSP